LVTACSNNNGNGNDGGSDAPSGDGGASTYTQTGTVIDYDNQNGVYDVIVTATYAGGTATATTDSTGAYTLKVPQNTAYTMSLSAGADAGKAYIGLNEQEWKLTGDANRGKTSFVSAGTQGLLESLLSPTPSATLAVLSIQVQATGSCASATGAMISVPGLPDPDAGAGDGGTTPVLIYFGGSPSLPDQNATSVTDGLLPSAIVYNLPVTAAYNSVTVTPPAGCTVKPFPVADSTIPTIDYTGNVTLTPGSDAVSFMRVFLE
jgi:hypothetical protein